MRSLLFVCTANICRSPVAEHLLRQRLVDRTDSEGLAWTVRSAGLGRYQLEVDEPTRRAVSSLGLDLSGHRPRVLDAGVVAADGADLVLTMTREHLRTVATLVPGAWRRTFTLKELARRSSAAGPPHRGEAVSDWLERLSAGRKPADLLRPDPDDDLADPYGLERHDYEAMVAEVRNAVDALMSTLWVGPDPGSGLADASPDSPLPSRQG